MISSQAEHAKSSEHVDTTRGIILITFAAALFSALAASAYFGWPSMVTKIIFALFLPFTFLLFYWTLVRPTILEVRQSLKDRQGKQKTTLPTSASTVLGTRCAGPKSGEA